MLTVGINSVDVEARLLAGRLACSGCGGRLGPWGYARLRVLRGFGRVRWRLRPRRGICSGCGRTHVLLAVGALARRADAVAVIGAALTQAAAGVGHRRIAAWLGLPPATVRGWLRRFAVRAGRLRQAFTVLACELDPDPRLPGPAGSDLADAVAAVGAAAAAMARRWAVSASAVSPWQLACAATAGGLLAPGRTVKLINTTRLW